ncbi:MAG: hypothetical protein QXS76_00085 [Candidatus Bathyarchaeia archaeon]
MQITEQVRVNVLARGVLAPLVVQASRKAFLEKVKESPEWLQKEEANERKREAHKNLLAKLTADAAQEYAQAVNQAKEARKAFDEKFAAERKILLRKSRKAKELQEAAIGEARKIVKQEEIEAELNKMVLVDLIEE